jgi:hypothetical protein
MNTESEHESEGDTRQDLPVSAGEGEGTAAGESLSHANSSAGLPSDKDAIHDESDNESIDNERLRRRFR